MYYKFSFYKFPLKQNHIIYKPYIPDSKEYLFTKLTNIIQIQNPKKYIEMNDIGLFGNVNIL